MTDKLLTLDEAAERLGTPVRFVRRLVEERRIGFTKLGRYVRIPASDLDAFVAAGRVEPVAAHPRAEHRFIPARRSFPTRRG